jgi:hypothetical protein
MIQSLLNGIVHAFGAIGAISLGEMLAQGTPISDHTSITIGVGLAIAAGAFYVGVALTNIRRDIGQLKESIKLLQASTCDNNNERRRFENSH